MEFEILVSILLVGLSIGMAVTPLLGRISKAWDETKMMFENNKKFAQKQAEVDKMRASGDFHEWVTVVTPTGERMVCKKTGWCPSLNGFIPMDLINEYFTKLQLEKEYQEYRNMRVSTLSKELGLDLVKTEEIVSMVFSIKKDFYIERMIRLAKEIEGKGLDDKQQNKI